MSNHDTVTKLRPPRDRFDFSEHRDEDGLCALTYTYIIHGKPIAVLVSYDVPPQYDQGDSSLPAQYLGRYDAASWGFMGEPKIEDTV